MNRVFRVSFFLFNKYNPDLRSLIVSISHASKPRSTRETAESILASGFKMDGDGFGAVRRFLKLGENKGVRSGGKNANLTTLTPLKGSVTRGVRREGEGVEAFLILPPPSMSRSSTFSPSPPSLALCSSLVPYNSRKGGGRGWMNASQGCPISFPVSFIPAKCMQGCWGPGNATGYPIQMVHDGESLRQLHPLSSLKYWFTCCR